jgi:hypothetical protein
MAKEKLPAELQLADQAVNLFDVLAALDRKDYNYYKNLSETQKKGISFYILVQWMSTIKGNKDTQSYYLRSTDYHANKYLFNENVQKHPHLVWLMLCAASPGIGKQFHQWIPQIKDRVSKLKESPKVKEIKEYFKKIYPKVGENDIALISEVYVDSHRKRMYLANKYPSLKYDEIELLGDLITDEDIEQYEKDSGN